MQCNIRVAKPRIPRPCGAPKAKIREKLYRAGGLPLAKHNNSPNGGNGGHDDDFITAPLNDDELDIFLSELVGKAFS